MALEGSHKENREYLDRQLSVTQNGSCPGEEEMATDCRWLLPGGN